MPGGRQLYHPYGTVRWFSGTLLADFTFTGERNDSYLDILAMGVRWYSPRAARWISADIIVPDPADPRTLDRYSYVTNNPLRYTDPSGHIKEAEYDDALWWIEQLRSYGVYVEVDFGWADNPTPNPGPYDEVGPIVVWEPGAWELAELQDIHRGVVDLSEKLAGSSFAATVGPVNVRRFHGADLRRWACVNVYPKVTPQALTLGRSVTFYDEWSAGTRAARARVAVHEFAHVWDHGVGSFESESIGEYVGLEARVNSSALASAQEHWAETVESWVYDPRGVLGPRHRQFVGLAVQGQAPAPSNYVDPYQGWWTQ